MKLPVNTHTKTTASCLCEKNHPKHPSLLCQRCTKQHQAVPACLTPCWLLCCQGAVRLLSHSLLLRVCRRPALTDSPRCTGTPQRSSAHHCGCRGAGSLAAVQCSAMQQCRAASRLGQYRCHTAVAVCSSKGHQKHAVKSKRIDWVCRLGNSTSRRMPCALP